MSLIPIDRRPKHVNDIPGANYKRLQYIHCPTCGNQMALRQNRQMNNLFYGCTKFPDCTGTRQAEQVDEYCNRVVQQTRIAQGDLRTLLSGPPLIDQMSDIGLSRRRRAAQNSLHKKPDMLQTHVVAGSPVIVTVPITTGRIILPGQVVLLEHVAGIDYTIRYKGQSIKVHKRDAVRGIIQTDRFTTFVTPAGTNFDAGEDTLELVAHNGNLIICRTNPDIYMPEVIRVEFDDLFLLQSPAHKAARDEYDGLEDLETIDESGCAVKLEPMTPIDKYAEVTKQFPVVDDDPIDMVARQFTEPQDKLNPILDKRLPTAPPAPPPKKEIRIDDVDLDLDGDFLIDI